MTEALAIYAALVATAGLVWQILVWRRTHRRDLRVSIGTTVTAEERIDEETGAKTVFFAPTLVISVANHGGRTEYIEALGVAYQEGIPRWPAAAAHPRELPPQERRTATVIVEHIPFDIDERSIIGYAELGTGDAWGSDPMLYRSQGESRGESASWMPPGGFIFASGRQEDEESSGA